MSFLPLFQLPASHVRQLTSSFFLQSASTVLERPRCTNESKLSRGRWLNWLSIDASSTFVRFHIISLPSSPSVLIRKLSKYLFILTAIPPQRLPSSSELPQGFQAAQRPRRSHRLNRSPSSSPCPSSPSFAFDWRPQRALGTATQQRGPSFGS